MSAALCPENMKKTTESKTIREKSMRWEHFSRGSCYIEPQCACLCALACELCSLNLSRWFIFNFCPEKKCESQHVSIDWCEYSPDGLHSQIKT